MGKLGAFNFREMWPHGLQIFATNDPLMPAMISEGEIDIQVQAMKDDLDAVAARMKKALKKRPVSMLHPTSS